MPTMSMVWKPKYYLIVNPYKAGFENLITSL